MPTFFRVRFELLFLFSVNVYPTLPDYSTIRMTLPSIALAVWKGPQLVVEMAYLEMVVEEELFRELSDGSLASRDQAGGRKKPCAASFMWRSSPGQRNSGVHFERLILPSMSA